MYYLRIKIHGDYAICEVGRKMTKLETLAYWHTICTQYAYDFVQLWHNGQFEYTII